MSCHVACQVDHKKLHLTPGEAAPLLAELPPSFHTRFEDAFRIQVAYTARLPTKGLCGAPTGLERVCVCVCVQLDHFADIALRGVEPLVTEHDCIQAHLIAHAALESYRSKAPVSLLA